MAKSACASVVKEKQNVRQGSLGVRAKKERKKGGKRNKKSHCMCIFSGVS